MCVSVDVKVQDESREGLETVDQVAEDGAGQVLLLAQELFGPERTELETDSNSHVRRRDGTHNVNGVAEDILHAFDDLVELGLVPSHLLRLMREKDVGVVENHVADFFYRLIFDQLLTALGTSITGANRQSKIRLTCVI